MSYCGAALAALSNHPGLSAEPTTGVPSDLFDGPDCLVTYLPYTFDSNQGA